MQNHATIDGQSLLFGNYAIRRFCRLQLCTNDPTVILSEFQGDNKADALFNLVQSGIEAAYAQDKKEFTLTEFEVSAFVDKLNTRTDKGDSVVNAFVGSVIGKPATEVPAWMDEVTKEAERLFKLEQEAATDSETKTDESPNQPAAETSQRGKKSKAAPSDTV